MNTLKKIGNAALQRVFKPEVKVRGTVEFKREVSCQNDFSLWQTIGYSSYEETNENVHSYKVKVYLWGIELGLIEVDTEKALSKAKSHFLAYGTTLAECLTLGCFYKNPKPSHCIIVECYSDYWTIDKFGNDDETVKIYSISEAQKNELERLYCQSTIQAEFPEEIKQ